MEAETLALAQEIDFSFWALFARATFTVKAVILMLIAASFLVLVGDFSTALGFPFGARRSQTL